MCHTFELS